MRSKVCRGVPTVKNLPARQYREIAAVSEKFDIICFGNAAADWAKKAGIPVTLDPDTLNPELEKLVKKTSVVLGSETLSDYLSSKPSKAAEEILRLGPKVAVLTFGDKGCLVKTRGFPLSLRGEVCRGNPEEFIRRYHPLSLSGL